jgi:hypothetical protein
MTFLSSGVPAQKIAYTTPIFNKYNRSRKYILQDILQLEGRSCIIIKEKNLDLDK